MEARGGVDDLSRLSGISKPTTKAALQELSDTDPPLVINTSRYDGWTLTLAGSQMLLSSGSEKFFHSNAISSSINNLNNDSLINDNTTTSAPSEKIIASDPDIVQLLHEYGIYDPKASQLAAMPHMNAEYINAHLTKLKKLDLALIIWKMEKAQPAPNPPAVGACQNCGQIAVRSWLCEDCETE